VINLKELFSAVENSDEKIISKLLIAIKDGQQDGFDYLKFKHSYIALQNMGMDEAKAAKSAFLTASTMGFTKEKLLASARTYLNILSKEREIFANALKYQIANNIDSRRVEIARSKEKIQENLRKIEQLQKENALLEQNALQIEEGLDTAGKKIEETRDKFKNTFDKLFNEIEDDLLLYDKFL
jgi:hypothetical protein